MDIYFSKDLDSAINDLLAFEPRFCEKTGNVNFILSYAKGYLAKGECFSELHKLMGVVIKQLTKDFPVEEKYGDISITVYGRDIFNNKAYLHNFFFAMECIRNYCRYMYADKECYVVEVPEALKKYYDDGEGLLDVTNCETKGRYFVFPSCGYAVRMDCKLGHLSQKLINIVSEKALGNGSLKIHPFEILYADEIDSRLNLLEAKIWSDKFTEDKFFNPPKEIVSGSFCYQDEQTPLWALRVPLKRLEYVVKREANNESSAMIEEVIDVDFPYKNRVNEFLFGGADESYYVRQRMVHMMYKIASREFYHLDLENLYYDNSLYLKRVNQHLKDRLCRTKKEKVFVLQDVGLDYNEMCNIASLALESNANPEVAQLIKGE